ncbi:histone-like nucleoid-structuring protein Lsr2 [Streptomyces puniciscabiei]|uniref:Lsr2 family DNA-binding protein n=1 Tax=Streptomyces puniciscabiei TaxID=164348 RepID=UPI0037B3EFF8
MGEWPPPLPPAGVPTADPEAVREWARANGFDVPMRGRIPAAVRQAGEQAHGSN